MMSAKYNEEREHHIQLDNLEEIGAAGGGRGLILGKSPILRDFSLSEDALLTIPNKQTACVHSTF